MFYVYVVPAAAASVDCGVVASVCFGVVLHVITDVVAQSALGLAVLYPIAADYVGIAVAVHVRHVGCDTLRAFVPARSYAYLEEVHVDVVGYIGFGVAFLRDDFGGGIGVGVGYGTQVGVVVVFVGFFVGVLVVVVVYGVFAYSAVAAVYAPALVAFGACRVKGSAEGVVEVGVACFGSLRHGCLSEVALFGYLGVGVGGCVVFVQQGGVYRTRSVARFIAEAAPPSVLAGVFPEVVPGVVGVVAGSYGFVFLCAVLVYVGAYRCAYRSVAVVVYMVVFAGFRSGKGEARLG